MRHNLNYCLLVGREQCEGYHIKDDGHGLLKKMAMCNMCACGRPPHLLCDEWNLNLFLDSSECLDSFRDCTTVGT